MPYVQHGLPFRRGSHASYRGAQHAARRRGQKLMLLLGAYVAASARGLTGHEAVEATGFPMQSICSLRAALKDAGEIRHASYRMERYGVEVDVHVATDAGVVALRAHGRSVQAGHVVERERCECGGSITHRRTADPFEDTWTCDRCTKAGTSSWSRTIGPRALER